MGEIQVERGDHGVATVWLSNPGRLNVLGDAMVIALCEALPRLADDRSCRAIVLRGRDGVFSAGRDLADLKALQDAGDPEAVASMYGYLQTMNEVIYGSPVPIVGVVEKYAFGIATMLVCWCDIAIAEEGALLGFPEVQHGITPYGAVPTMLNAVSQKVMLDLMLTGRKIAAPEALRLGILSRVARADALADEIGQVVADLARGSAEAIRRTKAFIRQCEDLTYPQGIALATEKSIVALGRPDLRKGLAAFAGKKKPDWN